MEPLPDYYTILGVASDATAEEIKRAHYRLTRIYHPDHNGGGQEYVERMKAANAARDILLDTSQRAEYDALRKVETQIKDIRLRSDDDIVESKGESEDKQYPQQEQIAPEGAGKYASDGQSLNMRYHGTVRRFLVVGLNLLGLMFSVALLYAAWRRTLPEQVAGSVVEALGVVTGAWTVWLTVKEHIWNWPIGLVSSVCYVVVFYESKLYGDMALQVVYIVLGILGWYWWLYGGKDKTALDVVRADRATLLVVCTLVLAGTAGMTIILERIKDAAPFLDAFTTAISLGAQYLITKKMIENWYGWLAADVIYVYLYWVKHTPLTAILYFGYLIMCVLGLIAWYQALKNQKRPRIEVPLEPLHG